MLLLLDFFFHHVNRSIDRHTFFHSNVGFLKSIMMTQRLTTLKLIVNELMIAVNVPTTNRNVWILEDVWMLWIAALLAWLVEPFATPIVL
jgi:hypothetical protein